MGFATVLNSQSSNIKDDLKLATSATIPEKSLKRHHDEIEDSGADQHPDTTQEQSSKKARATPQKASTSMDQSLAVKREALSATIPKATTNTIAQKRKSSLNNLMFIRHSFFLIFSAYPSHPSASAQADNIGFFLSAATKT
jgi:hypothetical protein